MAGLRALRQSKLTFVKEYWVCVRVCDAGKCLLHTKAGWGERTKKFFFKSKRSS
jgi:hypothetical protein